MGLLKTVISGLSDFEKKYAKAATPKYGKREMPDLPANLVKPAPVQAKVATTPPAAAPAAAPAVPASNVAALYTQVDQHEKFLQDQLKAQQRAAEIRTKEALNANSALIPKIEERTNNDIRGIYLDREVAKRNMPDVMAAQGYTGGLTETSLMGINTGYENSKNKIMTDRNNSLQDVYNSDRAIRTAAAAGDADLLANYHGKALQMKLDDEQRQRDDAARDRAEYAANINAYYSDFQAEKNKILGDGDPTNDWKAMYLDTGRNAKIKEMEQAARDRAVEDRDYALNKAQTMYQIGKPYYKYTSSSDGGPLSGSEGGRSEESALADKAYYDEKGLAYPPDLATDLKKYGYL